MDLLPSTVIPKRLWRDGVLHLPMAVVETFRKQLASMGLLEEASRGVLRNDIIGGASDDESVEHFAHRFGVSAGRVQFATLNPDGGMKEVSDAVLSTFSEGRIAVLDIPCGSGGASCGLVATLLELRDAKVMPRLPLSISILGGDFAPRARDICAAMMSGLVDPARAEGITIRFSVTEWNGTQSDATAKLIDEWFVLSDGAEEFVVLVSAFSGHLKNATTFAEFSPCLEHILARLHGKRATVLWIEPKMDQAANLFQWLKNLFLKLTGRFQAPWGSPPESKSAGYQIANPLNQQVHKSGLVVQSFTRP